MSGSSTKVYLFLLFIPKNDRFGWCSQNRWWCQPMTRRLSAFPLDPTRKSRWSAEMSVDAFLARIYNPPFGFFLEIYRFLPLFFPKWVLRRFDVSKMRTLQVHVAPFSHLCKHSIQVPKMQPFSPRPVKKPTDIVWLLLCVSPWRTWRSIRFIDHCMVVLETHYSLHYVLKSVSNICYDIVSACLLSTMLQVIASRSNKWIRRCYRLAFFSSLNS